MRSWRTGPTPPWGAPVQLDIAAALEPAAARRPQPAESPDAAKPVRPGRRALLAALPSDGNFMVATRNGVVVAVRRRPELEGSLDQELPAESLMARVRAKTGRKWNGPRDHLRPGVQAALKEEEARIRWDFAADHSDCSAWKVFCSGKRIRAIEPLIPSPVARETATEVPGARSEVEELFSCEVPTSADLVRADASAQALVDAGEPGLSRPSR